MSLNYPFGLYVGQTIPDDLLMYHIPHGRVRLTFQAAVTKQGLHIILLIVRRALLLGGRVAHQYMCSIYRFERPKPVVNGNMAFPRCCRDTAAAVLLLPLLYQYVR